MIGSIYKRENNWYERISDNYMRQITKAFWKTNKIYVYDKSYALVKEFDFKFAIDQTWSISNISATIIGTDGLLYKLNKFVNGSYYLTEHDQCMAKKRGWKFICISPSQCACPIYLELLHPGMIFSWHRKVYEIRQVVNNGLYAHPLKGEGISFISVSSLKGACFDF